MISTKDDEERIAEEILVCTRDELCMDYPFFRPVMSAFTFTSADRLVTSAVDGETMFYSKTQLLRIFKENPVFCNRLYLHSVLHLLFSHLWIRGARDPVLWGIACDMAVEYTIDHLDKPSVKRTLSLIRTDTYRILEERGQGISAGVIISYLYELQPEKIRVLKQEFFADDHVFWPRGKRLTDRETALYNRYLKLGKETDMRRRRAADSGEETDPMSYQIRASKRRRCYRDFLKDFMVFYEEMHMDPDEFDIGFYMYGLSLSFRQTTQDNPDRMPLIELLESREINKIRDFVVVVDTSYSTSGEMVVGFLKETLQIVSESDSFFRKGRLHLIQADDRVREDIILNGDDQIEALFDRFEIKGGGNTDFRPAFTYVDELSEKGAFEDLCGLLYFTDGQGIYPEKQPPYRTAFVFPEEYENSEVPPWAIRMVLDHNEGGKGA